MGDGYTTDISTRLAPLGAGGGTFDTNGNNVTLATPIAGAGGYQGRRGHADPNGVNTYSGGTTINAGTLRLGAGTSLPVGGALTINGGLFDIGSNNLSLNSLSGSGGSVMLGGGTLTYNSAGSTSFGSAITGSGTLAVKGGGVLTQRRSTSRALRRAGRKLGWTAAVGQHGDAGRHQHDRRQRHDRPSGVSGGTVSLGNSIGTLSVNVSWRKTTGI